MFDRRTIKELTKAEFDELKVVMLYDDENEFYEDIDEITDEAVYERFAAFTFKTSDFACNFRSGDNNDGSDYERAA